MSNGTGTTASTRRALVVEGPPGNGVSLKQKPCLFPGPGEIVARPYYVGLCGTDLELVGGLLPPAFVRYPLTIGHEWSGHVLRCGEGVKNVNVGDHIVVEGLVPCLSCDNCKRGDTNICVTYQETGFTREGAASDEVLVPAHQAHRLDPHVSPLDSALCEPSAVVRRALLRASPRPGSRVLIIGDGTVALLTAHLARLHNPSTITMLGLRPEQASLAKVAGVTSFTTKGGEVCSGGGGYDVVVEAAGVTETVTTAIKAAGRGATVILLGLPPDGQTVPFPVTEVVYKDLKVVASFSYNREAWASVVDLLNKKSITPSALVTHRFPLAHYDKALAVLKGGVNGARGKVLLEVGAEGKPS